MLHHRKAKKEMTDFDAAAALLMLSSGSRSMQQIESNNNYSKTIPIKPHQPCVQSSAPSAVSVVVAPESKSALLASNPKTAVDLTRPRIRPKTDREVPSREKNAHIVPISIPRTTSPASENEAPLVTAGRAAIARVFGRFGSSSPDLQRWDSSRTSSPIVQNSSGLPSPHSVHDGYGDLRGPVAYDSPGMNGFARQLNKAADHDYVSSPEPSPMSAPVMPEREWKRRPRLYNPQRSSSRAGPSSSNSDEKSLNSPTDSGVSSIHDEILQPNLAVQMWSRGSDMGDGLPSCVRDELRKIVEMSALKRKQYTTAKLEKFPLEMGFNPNKSRQRKKCNNVTDDLDREKNNAASRRSRHKKKLMTHMMNIGLEYDRNENRQLYMQESWLSNMIFELEEKALNLGTEPQVLRKLRANCGFQ